MERLLRFLISQALNGVIVSFGLILILFSISGFRSSYKALAFLDRSKTPGESLAIWVADSLEAAYYDPALLFVPPLLWLWMVIPGLLIIGFGVRRMVRRLIDGVPKSEISRPQTGSALWGTTVAYVIGVILSGPSLIAGFINAPTTIPYVLFGEEAEGTVEAVRENAELTSEGKKTYQVTLAFTGVDGQHHKSTIEMSAFWTRNVQRASTVELTYVPGNPNDVFPTRGVPGLKGYIWFFVWRFAFLYVGICGLMRNFLPNGIGPIRTKALAARRQQLVSSQPDLNVKTKTPPPSNPRPPSMGRRKEFGRRGSS